MRKQSLLNCALKQSCDTTACTMHQTSHDAYLRHTTNCRSPQQAPFPKASSPATASGAGLPRGRTASGVGWPRDREWNVISARGTLLLPAPVALHSVRMPARIQVCDSKITILVVNARTGQRLDFPVGGSETWERAVQAPYSVAQASMFMTCEPCSELRRREPIQQQERPCCRLLHLGRKYNTSFLGHP